MYMLDKTASQRRFYLYIASVNPISKRYTKKRVGFLPPFSTNQTTTTITFIEKGISTIPPVETDYSFPWF